MLSLILQILTILSAIVMGISAYTHPANENESRHNRRRILMAILGFILVVGQIWLAVINYCDNENAKTEKLIDKRISDSLLKDCGLKVELSKNETKKYIKDSINHTTNFNTTSITKSESPTIVQMGEGGELGLKLNPDKSSYRYEFHCLDASAVDVKFTFSYATSNNLIDFIYQGNLTINEIIPKGHKYYGDISRDTSNKMEYFIMWTRGTYKNSDRSKTIPFDKLMIYDLVENTLKTGTMKARSNIEGFIKKNEK